MMNKAPIACAKISSVKPKTRLPSGVVETVCESCQTPVYASQCSRNMVKEGLGMIYCGDCSEKYIAASKGEVIVAMPPGAAAERKQWRREEAEMN